MRPLFFTIKENSNLDKTNRTGLIIVVAVIILAVLTYTVAVVAGYLPSERRIDTANLAVITLAIICVFLLLNPGIFERLKMFEVSGFKLEMLESVKEQQAEQQSKLEDIALILPLLLPKAEQKHLLNLAGNKTADYKGNSALRSELRRLRTIGLVKSLPKVAIGQIKDNAEIDLAEYVGLTMLGERWVQRIIDIEKAEGEEEKSNNH